MKYLELRSQITNNLFSLLDVNKLFPFESQQLIQTQLARFAKRGLLTKIKREWYCFNPQDIDELELANILYAPSYVSLETALNYYGLIPDVSQAVTSINLTTTKKITNKFGSFYYAKINKSLFFGFTKIPSTIPSGFINIAFREKALLDYFYIRKISKLNNLRLDRKLLDLKLYHKWLKFYPNWMQKIKLS